MKRHLIASLYIFLILFSSPLWGRSQSNISPPYPDPYLRKLLAPIALYPDPLLAQILPASTYPLEIVQASRAIQREEDFPFIDSKNWDPSVKAVAHYPEILKMMNEKLEWTEQLGQAVMAQQQDVLRTVQDLRRQALKNGTLQATRQQKVIQTEDAIEIIPTSPEIVYVPSYDSEIVYDASGVDAAAPLISFGLGYALGSWLNTGFYWPGYSVVYGGPYYWGWNDYRRPYWNRYPNGWNDWGWNHWRPRRNYNPSAPPIYRPYPVPPPPVTIKPTTPLYPKPGVMPQPSGPYPWKPGRTAPPPSGYSKPSTPIPGASSPSTSTVRRVTPVKSTPTSTVRTSTPTSPAPSGSSVPHSGGGSVGSPKTGGGLVGSPGGGGTIRRVGVPGK